MKKLFLYLSIVTIFLAILPLPLAYLVDITYHWLLIVTLPFGGILSIIFIVIWAVIKEKPPKEEIIQEINNT